MVFAVALHLDAAQHDHIVIALDIFEGARQFDGWVLIIALEPFAKGLDNTLRRIEQALAARIITGPSKQGANSGHGLFAGWLDQTFCV